MKKLIVSMLIILLVSFSSSLSIKAESNSSVTVPYYTYTADSNKKLIPTVDAYVPMNQIVKINDEELPQLEHIYVDENDYLYISDSRNRKVYVLDESFNYVTEITHQKLTFPVSSFVTTTQIYVVDQRSSTILIFDKEELLINNTVQLNKEILPPDSPIFKEGYIYRPKNIAVDPRGSIYVQGVGSYNGLMMLDEDGQFMTFFAGNPLRVPLVDQLRSMFLTDVQKNKMEKIFEDVPTDLARDQKGFIYTVTQSLPSNPVKKFNVAGKNFLQNGMIGSVGMLSIWIGQHNNIVTVDINGNIYEYDQNGNLLFLFGGMDFSGSRTGLLITPSSVATNSRDEIIVLDKGGKFIQVYQPTIFTKTVHTALMHYQRGEYIESTESWQKILEYNAMFDYAHRGLGDAYMLANEYQLAYEEYNFAKDYEGISNAFWGVRQEWLQENLNTVFTILVIILMLYILYRIYDNRLRLSETFLKGINFVRRKVFIIDELLFIFEFLRHPLDGYYQIKTKNRVSTTTATIIYVLLIGIFVAHYQLTNQIFVPKTNTNFIYEIFIIIGAFALWTASSYLICSINEGEGSIKNVYQATAYALTPILIVMPLVIALSNVLTYQEQVFYTFGQTFMIIWVIFQMFFMIKDIHNYEVKETIIVTLKSFFTMLIIGLFIYIVTSLFGQFTDVIREMITEVINR